MKSPMERIEHELGNLYAQAYQLGWEDAIRDVDRAAQQAGENSITDEEAMNSIAHLLGTHEEWSSAADFLSDIADLVSLTSRQHPGDADPDTYNYKRTL